jgi:dUTP pyrophosphatase
MIEANARAKLAAKGCDWIVANDVSQPGVMGGAANTVTLVTERDLRASVPESEPIVLNPGSRCMAPTGFSVAVPDGFEMQVRPRSGLAFKNGVTVVNAPGTVDSDYRGQVCVLLINLGEEDFTIRRGDRIAQGVIAAAPQWPLVEVDDLDATDRGAGGFGSTGV